MADKDKFEIDIDDVVRRYADMVYRLAILNSKYKYEAEDAFQEVFIKLYKNKERIKDEEHLKAWLIRVTVNQCRSMAVTAFHRHTISVEDVGEIEATEQLENDYELYVEVKKLPKKYRDVIYLYYYEEMPIKDIAKILGRKEATIKTQLVRGRNLLGERLKGERENEREG